MTEPVQWITPREAAQQARLSAYTIYVALESGELHGHQRTRGGRWQINPAAVDAWIRGMDGPTACGCARLRAVKKTA
jgi:excisionase family DNA binding protein